MQELKSNGPVRMDNGAGVGKRLAQSGQPQGDIASHAALS